MSYEGFEVVLCRNGHLHEEDCYSGFNTRTWRCPICQEPMVYFEGVDQTNHCGVRVKLEVFAEEEWEQCNHCGHEKKTKEAQYYIPSNNNIYARVATTEDKKALVPVKKCKYETCSDSNLTFDTEDEAIDYIEKETLDFIESLKR